MECAFFTIGLFALAGAACAACVVALMLSVLPQIFAGRRAHERAAFLRAQLLHQFSILPQFVQERDRPLPLEHRDVLDDCSYLAQQASLLEMEEWTSVLRVQALLTNARNRPSLTKREARLAHQAIDHAAAVLRTYAADDLHRGPWWKTVFSSRRARPTALGPAINQPFTLRDTVG